MTRKYPTRRPTDAEYSLEESEPIPPELTSMPWIDIHNHAHTLSWNEREKFAISGCRSMVMMAAAYYWTPYKPVAPEDVRYLWDDALSRLAQIRESHLLDANVGIGIHTGARVENYEDLLDVLPEYCEFEEVVAIGEIGITEAQHVAGWDLESQKDVTRRQLEIAADHNLPAILHTPADLEDIDFPDRVRGDIPGYELDLSLQQEPVLTSDYPKREAIEIDIDLKDDAGLPDEQLVLSHADKKIAPYVLENTDCYLSFTVSYPWLLGVTPTDVAEVVAEYGPDRILVETDSAGVLRSDVFAFKRTILEMYRMGLDVETIRQVVYENPRDVLD
ncbi:TatD family hydrolase [Natronorubrum halophilum]|uniref:TatD family hydrolase n=1 Tax=Natronorubrum halophilum TaxID=1702106 RepID=UPI0010C16CC7|nr:TatD family hydrolase [Natronorubrum halophilum]